VKLLCADLFHMNIEEADIAAAIRAGGSHIWPQFILPTRTGGRRDWDIWILHR